MADDDIIIERAGDTEALLAFVENHLSEVIETYKEQVVHEVARRNGLDLDLDVELRERVFEALDVRKVDLRTGFFEDAVLDVITESHHEGVWGTIINGFLAHQEHPPLRPGERRKMIQELRKLGIDAAVADPTRDHTVARVYRSTSARAAARTRSRWRATHPGDAVELPRPHVRSTSARQVHTASDPRRRCAVVVL